MKTKLITVLKITVVSIIILKVIKPVYSQSKILINEFIVDPQPQQVEVINLASESSDISGWIIDDSGGSTFYTIPTHSVLYPNSCLVFSSDFNLNKSSADTVRLFDKDNNLIDSFSYQKSPGTGISFFRLPDGGNNWTTGSASFGLYNESRQSCVITPTPIPTQIPSPTPIPPSPSILTATPIPTSEPTLISYDNIYLSEVMVNPPLKEKEWVEIYNDNDFSVSLINWYVDDLENAGSSPKTFSLEIPPKNYAVFELNSSIFNNDGDSVRLLDFNKIEKDSFEYSFTVQGKTLGRTNFNSDNFCLQEPSKGTSNNLCLEPTSTPTTITINTPIAPKSSSSTATFSSIFSPLKTNASVSKKIKPLESPLVFNFTQGEVLGKTVENQNPNNSFLFKDKSLLNSLLLVSFSYPILTIISILIKMLL